MDSIIKIRVSAADKAEFEAAAEYVGLSLSAWARHHLKSLMMQAKTRQADRTSYNKVTTKLHDGSLMEWDVETLIVPKGTSVTGRRFEPKKGRGK